MDTSTGGTDPSSRRSARLAQAGGVTALALTGGAVERVVAWRAARGERVITDLSWSRSRDSVAFATRDPSGGVTLVVVLVGGEADGEVMTWDVPQAQVGAARRIDPTLTWLGAQRVAFGHTEVRANVIASWDVRVW